MFLTKQELKELLISESKATLNINIKFEGALDLATTSKNIKQTRTTMAYHKKETKSVDNKGILRLFLHYVGIYFFSFIAIKDLKSSLAIA